MNVLDHAADRVRNQVRGLSAHAGEARTLHALDQAASVIRRSEKVPPSPHAALAASGASWWRRTRDTAPLAPRWLRAMVVRTLLDPTAKSDALLIFADALEEAARVAAIEGEMSLAAELHQLAELPRELAPRRSRDGIR